MDMAAIQGSAKAPAMSLACIVPHYGKNELTLRCVASLERGSLIPLTVVVSNSSDDVALQKELAQRYSKVIFLSLKKNKGFAAACNAGMDVLAELKKQGETLDYVWLLNNDAWVNHHTASKLLAGLEHHPGCVCGTAVCRANTGKPECPGGFYFVPWLTWLRPCNVKRAHYIYGASMAFSWQLLEHVGRFDERFFLYYEEHDFCLRATKRGHHLAWIPEAIVWHGGGKKDATALALAQYHENLSTLLFLQKHYSRAFWPGLALRLAVKMLLLPASGQMKLLPCVFVAIRDYFCAVCKGGKHG